MKRPLFAVAILSVVVTLSPASAHPDYHYEGGCSITAVSDGTDSAGTTWEGEVHASVVATDTTGVPALVSTSVECRLYLNGVFGATVLSASGTTVAMNSATVSYVADPDDVVEMCDHVVVGGTTHDFCEQEFGIGGAGNPVIDVVNEATDCDFYDTSGTNSSYTSGPGGKGLGTDSWGRLFALIDIDEDEPSSDWGKATHRVNGPRHDLAAGTWSVEFTYEYASWDIQYGPGASEPGLEAVSRFGVQLEQFSGSPDVFVDGAEIEFAAPEEGTWLQRYGTFVLPLEVTSPGEYGGLFYVDAHARRNQGSWAIVATSVDVLAICWRYTG